MLSHHYCYRVFFHPGHLANVLQEANVPIISDAVCNAPDYYDSQITTSMFCAGYEKGGIDACQVRVCLCQCVFGAQIWCVQVCMSLSSVSYRSFCLCLLWFMWCSFQQFNACVCQKHTADVMHLLFTTTSVSSSLKRVTIISWRNALIRHATCVFRETAAARLWQTTACRRPVVTVC